MIEKLINNSAYMYIWLTKHIMYRFAKKSQEMAKTGQFVHSYLILYPFLPAVLTVLPSLEVHLAHSLLPADILCRGLVLQRSSEEGSAAEAGGGSIVDMASCRFHTNLHNDNLNLTRIVSSFPELKMPNSS